jgi:hypothetical protein
MVFVTQLRSLGTSLLAAACACAMLLSAAGARATDLPQFLVVDYHPLSKTLAAGSTPAHPLYDYVYRIDVRNAGAAAANVSGAVRSRLPSITVPDASADFGAVGAHQTKASTDTITLRANQFFDRRLDRKVSVNGKSQYQVAGNDEDDSQIPGLPLLPGLSHQLLGWYYDIKFQFLFQWTSMVRDNSAPAITKLMQQQGQTDGKPSISASYQDKSGGVDLASARLEIDGQDVSAQASVSATGISYTPAGALAAGPHSMHLEVANRANASAQAAWGFDIAEPKLLDVTLLSPSAGSVLHEPLANLAVRAKSNASYVTAVTMNGVELVPGALAGEAVYTGDVALKEGVNSIVLSAQYADGSSKTETVELSYDGPPRVTIVTPLDKSTLGPVNPNSPRDLTGNVERPVVISGKSVKPVASVTINQQGAVLDAAGTGFSFANFFLHEGVNLVNVVATDAAGRTATASVTVTVDQTAPMLSVEAPLKDAITSAARIDVRGVVNDAVEGWADAPYAQVSVSNAANGQVAGAKVADRFYIAEDVPLEVGANVLSVTATDQAGNVRRQQVTVTRIAAGSSRLTLLGGNRQRAAINAALAKPLSIVALAKDGNPLADLPVTFDVLRGTGTIAASVSAGDGVAPARNLVVRTDAAGRAQVWLTLGKQSGEAGNMVRASQPSIGEDTVFTATGEKGLPAFIRADSGVTQFGETGASALEPLSAVITDSEENRLPGVAVLFTVAGGDAGFIDAGGNRSVSATAITDKNGMAVVRPQYGAGPGLVRIEARVSDPASQADVSGASYQLQVLKQQDGSTSFSGKVLSHRGEPLPGVRVSIGRTSLSATADDSGYFSFSGQVPAGKLDLFIDGRTANVQSSQYPALHFEALAVRGQNNVLPHAIYLPPLLMSEAKIVGGDQDVTLKIPGFDGFEMVVKANSVTFPDGTRSGPLVVSPVQQDKLPMVPPGGYNGFMSPAWTIQPSGTRFDPPIQVKVPNSLALKPGETREIYQWDHDLATFVPMGRATVSEDGALLWADCEEKGSGTVSVGVGVSFSVIDAKVKGEAPVNGGTTKMEFTAIDIGGGGAGNAKISATQPPRDGLHELGDWYWNAFIKISEYKFGNYKYSLLNVTFSDKGTVDGLGQLSF